VDTPATMSRRRTWSILLLGVATACTSGGSGAPASPSASASDPVDPSVYAAFQMRPVTEVLKPSSPEWEATALSCSPESTEANACAASPDNAERTVLAGPTGSQERYVLGPVIVDGGDVSGTTARLQGTAGEVLVQLSPAGSDALEEATRVAAGTTSPSNMIAIVVNGRVVSAPVVQVPITSGQVGVTGLTRPAARLLSLRLTALAA
jgi:preprotein translocase subunit SecD